jgi:hypothetical protein
MGGYYYTTSKKIDLQFSDLDFILSMAIGFLSSLVFGLLVEGYDATFPMSILFPSYFLGVVTIIGEISAIFLYGRSFAWPILITSWGAIPFSCDIANWLFKLAIGH